MFGGGLATAPLRRTLSSRPSIRSARARSSAWITSGITRRPSLLSVFRTTTPASILEPLRRLVIAVALREEQNYGQIKDVVLTEAPRQLGGDVLRRRHRVHLGADAVGRFAQAGVGEHLPERVAHARN